MKVAIATWNGRISPVFDVARQVLILDVEAGCVIARREESLPGTDPQAQAGRLMALAPEILICGAISQPMADLLTVGNMKIMPFTAGGVDEVIAAWLAGSLPSSALAMPGCCGRRRGCHGEGGRRRNGQGFVDGKYASFAKM
jgi:predicted Fe-Mo cluster-binding NifX family protein